MGTRLRNSILVVLGLILALPTFGQTIGDFKMDETELYAMTKQMGQFIRRFNYEEDQFGYKINPKSPDYRNKQKRQRNNNKKKSRLPYRRRLFFITKHQSK